MKQGWMTAAVVLTLACPAAADERYALIVAGANGGAQYETLYRQWTTALSATLLRQFEFEPQHVVLLSDGTDQANASTAANVRRALAALREKMTRDDLLFVMFIGHGTFDGADAKFNLVGPDLESGEWAALLRPLPGRIVLVNTTAASFPFLERLAAPRRVVITATDSAAQRFDTVFPDYFVKALSDERADLDKNGRISIWEAFAAASQGVQRHYQQRGQLTTERALLDDNGDGVGKESGKTGEDGSLASRVYLDESLPDASPTDEVLLKLLQRKTTLETEVEDLKIRKTFLPADEYAREFERIMIELARVSHDIRQRTKS